MERTAKGGLNAYTRFNSLKVGQWDGSCRDWRYVQGSVYPMKPVLEDSICGAMKRPMKIKRCSTLLATILRRNNPGTHHWSLAPWADRLSTSVHLLKRNPSLHAWKSWTMKTAAPWNQLTFWKRDNREPCIPVLENELDCLISPHKVSNWRLSEAKFHYTKRWTLSPRRRQYLKRHSMLVSLHVKGRTSVADNAH